MKARSEDAERIATLYKRVYADKYSLTDFTNPKFICNALKKCYIWYLGFYNSDLIGSSVGVPDPWNHSFELGRTVIDSRFWGEGVAKTLCELVREEGLSKRYDIGWGTIRNYPVYRISIADGMYHVGFFAGRHQVENRETHLMCMRLSPRARQCRLVPPSNWIYQLPLVQEIINGLGLDGRPGGYPYEAVVGPRTKNSMKIEFDFHSVDSAAEISRISNCIHLFPEYLQVTLLADKLAHIDFFQRIGFRICAFLPAWCLKNRKRYDCVMMSNCVHKPELDDRRLKPVLKKFTDGFTLHHQVHKLPENMSRLIQQCQPDKKHDLAQRRF